MRSKRYKVTEFDDTKPEYGPGALAFELDGPTGLCYAIRRGNGTFFHMDGRFNRVTLDNSDRARRENVIRAYMITHPQHFQSQSHLWPETNEAWCDYYRMLDEQEDNSFRPDLAKYSPLHHDNRCPIHSKGNQS